MNHTDKIQFKNTKNFRISPIFLLPKKYNSGSLSVEAVFLSPLILTVLFLILSFCFLTHQRIWFTAAAYEAALTPSGELEKSKQLLNEAPLTSDLPKPFVTQTSNYIEVTYSGTVLTFLGNYKLNYKTIGKIELLHPTEHIRRMRLFQP